MKLFPLQMSLHKPDNDGSSSVPKESSYDFVQLSLGQSILIKPCVFQDLQGKFIETFNCAQFIHQLGLNFAQDCMSILKVHALRGLHSDFRTWKFLHYPRGNRMAKIINLNPSSPTYFESRTVDRNHDMLLIPPGFGNSFYVLENNTVYSYKKMTYFRAGTEFTLHYGCFKWPEGIDPNLSKRDSKLPKDWLEFKREMRCRLDLEYSLFVVYKSPIEMEDKKDEA